LKRGVSLQIPNEYGKHLAQILEPLDVPRMIGKSNVVQKAGDGVL